jgi:multiple sugar transport system substrate-binding protein
MPKQLFLSRPLAPISAAFMTLLILGSAAHSVQAQETVRVWTRSSADGRKTYDTIAEAFTRKTGIKVEYFNATTDFEQRVARAAAGGDLPDLIINDNGATGQFVVNGLLDTVDRSKIVGQADLHERAWVSAKGFDGNYYGVPTSVQANLLFIRKDWRNKLGLPVPQTWQDVETMARAFTEKDPDGNGKADTYGFVLPGSAQRGYTAWFISSYLWQAGGEFIRNVKPGQFKGALDEPAAISAVNYIRKLQCDLKVTQPGAMNAPTLEANKAFTSGQAGMYLSGPYHIALFDKEPGRQLVEAVPAPEGPAGRAVLAGGELAYFPKAAKNKAAAKLFAEFMISVDGQTLGMRAATGGLPVVRLPVNGKVDPSNIYNDPRWVMVAQEHARFSRSFPAIPNWTRMQQIIAEGFNSTLARCSSDVVGDMKKLNLKVNEELRAQNVLVK